MKIFTWAGNDVLRDYTNGLIVVLAPDLEAAHRAILALEPWADRQYPAVPTETVDIGDVDVPIKVWMVHGGG